MKRFTFPLHETYSESFFPVVRNKISIVEILMNTTKFMLVNPVVDPNKVNGEIILIVDKMSRLFFISEKRYFSIVFPFHVEHIDGFFSFTDKNSISVDSHLITRVLSFIQCDEFGSNCSLDFIEPIYIAESGFDNSLWTFFRELLLMDDGYIRYDVDEYNHNKFKARGEEHQHPLNHYDLFCSSSATFKIGLEKEIHSDEFIDLLNVKSDCRYIK